MPIRKDISLKVLSIMAFFSIIEIWFCLLCMIFLLTNITVFYDWFVLIFEFESLPEFGLGFITFFPWYFWPTFIFGLILVIIKEEYLEEKKILTEEEN